MPKVKFSRESREFGERLVAMLKAAGHPRRGAGAYLAKKYKVSGVTANAWLNGEHRADIPTSQKLAADHGWSFDQLYLGAKGDAPAASEDWPDVLGYAQSVGLGEGIEAEEYAHTHNLKFRASSLRGKRLNPKRLGVMYGKGDSMLPRIKSGDAILFNEDQADPVDEALFVIMTPGVGANEAYSVKRCRHFGDAVYFDALNPHGDHQWRKPRRMDDPKQPIKIIGRVRWIGSWED